MKLEVGMYVRTLEGIMKVIEIKEDRAMTRFVNEDGNVYFINDLMTNPSHNIIDLIEVGDYVNGKLVAKNEEVFTTDNIYIGRYLYEEDNSLICGEEDIKSIVTREQFEAMQYKVV